MREIRNDQPAVITSLLSWFCRMGHESSLLTWICWPSVLFWRASLFVVCVHLWLSEWEACLIVQRSGSDACDGSSIFWSWEILGFHFERTVLYTSQCILLFPSIMWHRWPAPNRSSHIFASTMFDRWCSGFSRELFHVFPIILAEVASSFRCPVLTCSQWFASLHLYSWYNSWLKRVTVMHLPLWPGVLMFF